MPKAKKTKTMSSKAMKKTKGGLVTKELTAQQPIEESMMDSSLQTTQSYDASLEVLRKR
jgi:hypothetical protein